MSAFTNVQSLAAAECGQAGGGADAADVTSTYVCLTHSVEKALHNVGGVLQDYNTVVFMNAE